MNTGRGALVVLLVALAGTVARTVPLVRTTTAVDLSALPQSIDSWRGVDVPPPDAGTLSILAADETLHRTYTDAGGAQLGLYAAYYVAQRPGVSVHSPLHCLPGTGWEPLEVGTIRESSGSMRRMIVRKGRERALVVYWYSVGGRTTGSEVASKLMLLASNAGLQPGGAALVRIVVPVHDSVAAAEARALAFARTLLPRWTALVS